MKQCEQCRILPSFKKQLTSREFSPATAPTTGQWWLLTDTLLLAFLSPPYLKETPGGKKKVVVGKTVSWHVKPNKCGWINTNFESMGPRYISRTYFFKLQSLIKKKNHHWYLPINFHSCITGHKIIEKQRIPLQNTPYPLNPLTDLTGSIKQCLHS